AGVTDREDVAVVEMPALESEGARDAALLAQRIARLSVAEIVAADRNRRPARNLEGLYEQLVIAVRARREAVAVFELHAEEAGLLARLDRPGAIDEIFERTLPGELPDLLDRCRTRAELGRRERPFEVVAAYEADFRVEVVADLQILGDGAITVAGVLKMSLVAAGVPTEAGGLGPGIEAVDVDVLKERHRRIEAKRLVGSRLRCRRRSVREHRPDAAAPKHIALDAQHREVGRRRVRRVVVAG